MQLSTQDSAQLNAVIGKLKACGDNDYRLLIEHLETASAYLLGAMPSECEHNLRMAQRSAERLSGKPLPSELGETIACVLKDLRLPHTTADSNETSAFFQRAGVNFGIFYPTRHVVAIFASLEAAQAESVRNFLTGPIWLSERINRSQGKKRRNSWRSCARMVRFGPV